MATATLALALMRSGQLTASQFLATCLDRIEQREAAVRAWIFLAAEAARQQAIQSDALTLAEHEGRPSRSPIMQPLRGIPIAVKDIFATMDMPTAWGTSIYTGRYLTAEAEVVSRLQAAGAIILGKTVTTELATAASGATCNPHNLAHTPGGSSSGSAAAVADGMVPIAIGSQTMGSILRPAAYCGIFGFKPTFGRISRQGMMPVCDDLDHVGLFARSLEDIQRVFTVLTVEANDGPMGDRGEPIVRANGESPLATIQPMEGLSSPECRLAWIQTLHWSQVEPVAQNQLHQAIAVLKQAGIHIEVVTLPAICHDYWDTVQRLCAYGLKTHHGKLIEQHREQCSSLLQNWLQRGQNIQPSAYEQARQSGAAYREAVSSILAQYDAILTPVTSGPAPYGLATTGSPIFCGIWTLCGLPALNMPIGKTSKGLPLGCQLVGRWMEDQRLLQIAAHCWQFLSPVWGGLNIPSSTTPETGPFFPGSSKTASTRRRKFSD
ncbi:MAG: amidase [Cyanobacteria bacterium P01_F01_bin.86]